MLKKIKTIAEIVRTLRRQENVGDIAILKLTLFNADEGNSSFRDDALAQKSTNFEPISIEELEKLPANTFGFAYAAFMRRNNLQPFNFSGRVEHLFERFPVSVRYARLHDMIHTLLGFDADIEGELGVYAFIAEQNYTSFLTRAYRTARIFSRIVKPGAWQRLSSAEQRGKRLARGAKMLISLPLEDWFGEPLDDLRRQLLPAWDEH